MKMISGGMMAMAGWLEGLTITNLENGEALLSGHMQDQAALYGVLNRINNLGLVLISVNVVLEADGIDKRMQSHEDEDNS